MAALSGRRPPPAHAQVLGALPQVFVTNQRGSNNCYAKSKAALSKRAARPDRMACVLGAPSAPPPPMPPPPACTGGHMTATVPGDVLSDLHRAGKIGDPLYELNFKDPAQQKLWMEDYTYTRSFELEGDSAEGAVIVFDSIKMGARVSVDGTLLGTVTDQFNRYVFPLAEALAADATEHNVVSCLRCV